MQELPAPVTTTDHYLRAILEELRSQKSSPAPVEQVVELKEPKRKAK